jgi:hypothetical protein
MAMRVADADEVKKLGAVKIKKEGKTSVLAGVLFHCHHWLKPCAFRKKRAVLVLIGIIKTRSG